MVRVEESSGKKCQILLLLGYCRHIFIYVRERKKIWNYKVSLLYLNGKGNP